VLITAAGTREQRLDHGRQWLQSLDLGHLPQAHAHFGEPDACTALRAIVAELHLPALASPAAAHLRGDLAEASLERAPLRLALLDRVLQ
jgi:hypothetical protein